MSEPQEERAAKYAWTRGAMNGDNAAIISALLETLPGTKSLDGVSMAQLEQARRYMAELWGRGISLNQFLQLTGLTGFFVEPAQPGLTMPNQMGSWMTYFRVWDTDKDANVTADGLKNLLRARLKSMPEEYVGWYRLLVYADVDCEPQEYPSPYQAGLTPHAICFDVNLADVEQLFPDIDRACATLSTLAQRNMRIGIGSFAQQEYDGFRKHSIYTKCMPYGMGTEWILFKNIHSRAGKFGWFWRLVAKWRDRTDK